MIFIFKHRCVGSSLHGSRNRLARRHVHHRQCSPHTDCHMSCEICCRASPLMPELCSFDGGHPVQVCWCECRRSFLLFMVTREQSVTHAKETRALRVGPLYDTKRESYRQAFQRTHSSNIPLDSQTSQRHSSDTTTQYYREVCLPTLNQAGQCQNTIRQRTSPQRDAHERSQH